MCAWPSCELETVTPRSQWCQPSRFCESHRYVGLKLGRTTIYYKTAHEVFERDNWTCHLCRKPIGQRRDLSDLWGPSVDHHVPVARGGSNRIDNLRASHLRCNLSKGAR